MSHKSLVVGTGVGLTAFIVLAILFSTSFSVQVTFNPVATLSAVVVALIGIIWFKKSNK